jgi:hypothetical protein
LIMKRGWAGLRSCEELDLTSVIPSETLVFGALDGDGRVGMLLRFYDPSGLWR